MLGNPGGGDERGKFVVRVWVGKIMVDVELINVPEGWFEIIDCWFTPEDWDNMRNSDSSGLQLIHKRCFVFFLYLLFWFVSLLFRHCIWKSFSHWSQAWIPEAFVGSGGCLSRRNWQQDQSAGIEFDGWSRDISRGKLSLFLFLHLYLLYFQSDLLL